MSAKDTDLQPNAAMAIVATSSPRLPSAAEIVAATGGRGAGNGGFIKRMFGQKPKAADQDGWKSGILLLPLGDALLIVSLMPGPYPWAELEGPCATSWWWPEAIERMRGHHYFFLVMLRDGSLEPVERRLILTQATAAVVRNTDTVGVYWAEGTVVHEPGEFLKQAAAAKPRDIPGTLWLDVRVEENGDGSRRCFTTGLAPLGFLEIEVPRCHLPTDQLMAFVGDTACYIINNRLQIAEGETMGPSATEQYQVRHVPSMFDRGPVMQLVMA